MDTETTTAISEAQSPDNFDVMAFIAGAAYPTKSVTIYRDIAYAYKYVELTKARTAREDRAAAIKADFVPDAAEDAAIADAMAKLEASKLTFRLQGMAPGNVAEATASEVEEAEAGDVSDAHFDRLIARSIYEVESSAGVKDKHTWTAEEVAKLRYQFVNSEFIKLLDGVISVNFTAAVMDSATDAGFPSGSADLA